MKLQLFPILIFLALSHLISFSQEQEENPSIQLSPQLDMLMRVPQTPEAAAFVKYGNIPVNMYTGTPNISVPLHTLQGRELSLPVSLDYDASGIKVDQIATWVGLGWNLNVGGAVTRQVQGLPDGYGLYGKIFEPKVQEFIQYVSQNNLTPGTVHQTAQYQKYFELTRELTNGQVDLQPDLFPFSVNGLSGTLFLDYQKERAFCMEHPNLAVEVDLSLEAPNPIFQLKSWKITAEDGTQYLFEKQEFTNHRGEAGPRNTGFSRRYVSAWYISKIISPNNRDIVEFRYSSTSPWLNKQELTHTLSGVSVVNQESNSSQCGGSASPIQYLPGPSDASYWAEQPYLESIQINGYKRAVFTRSTIDRKDLRGRKRLVSVNFYDPLGKALIHHVKLENGGLDGRDAGYYFGNSRSLDEKSMRLMLKSVGFYGDQPRASKATQRYRFEYYEPEKVPKRGSFATDMAGYYNGKHSNRSLVPSYVDNGVNLYSAGADRKPSLEYCRIGTLKKMVYPTGGETTFTYGLHRLPSNSNQSARIVKKRLIDLIGGADAGRNPYKFEYACYENEPTTEPIPLGRANTFSKNPNNTSFVPLKLNISVKTGRLRKGLMYLVIYKSGECARAGTGDCPARRYDFCDIYNWDVACTGDPEGCPISIPLSGDPRDMGLAEREIPFEDLPNGGYQVLAFNGDPEATLTVELTGIEYINTRETVEEGGLRVLEAIDKTDAATPALHTYYIYQNFAGWNSTFEPRKALENQYTSSGKRLFNPAFTQKQFSTACTPLIPNERAETEVTCERTAIYSNRMYPGSGHIGYSWVTEFQYDPKTKQINGFTVHNFYNEQISLNKIPGIQSPLSSRLNGRPKAMRIYDKDRTLLSEEIQEYAIEPVLTHHSTKGLVMESSRTITGFRMLSSPPGGSRNEGASLLSFMTFCKGSSDRDAVPPACTQAIECLFGTFPLDQQITHYGYNSFWIKPTQSSQIQHYLTGGAKREVVTKTEFHYGNPLHRQLTRSVVTASDGSTRETRFYYPDDNLTAAYYDSGSGVKRLFTDSELAPIQRLNRSGIHHINEVVATQQLHNGSKTIFWEKKTFQDFGSRVVPVAIANSNGQEELKTVAQLSYLNNGLSLAEVKRPQGPPRVMLYAYNYTLPVMSLVGVSLFGDRSSNSLSNRHPLITSLGRSTSPTQITSELAKIRAKVPEALITEYAYNSKLQLTRTTSPEGID
ncbi:MAG: hypothetical protein AAGA10_29240, partial [Bacteroidota bacterium]